MSGDFGAMVGLTPELQLVALMGYLLGSIPFGLLLTKVAGLGDIRAIGSGNIGATNVLRTGRKGLAALTLLLDGGKGAVAVALASLIEPQMGPLIAGLTSVVGHLFPVWLKFNGGKGVATTLGVLLAILWPVGLAACLTWLATAFVFRYSSLAALVAIGLSPVYAVILGYGAAVPVLVVIAVLVFLRHHANIRRLLKGQESKIGQKG